MADDPKATYLDSLKLTSQLAVLGLAGSVVAGVYLMQRAVGFFAGRVDVSSGTTQNGLFSFDFWFATLSLFGPIALLVSCQVTRVLLDERRGVFVRYREADGLDSLPPWTLSLTPEHPMRRTLVVALWTPFIGLLGHLVVAVAGLSGYDPSPAAGPNGRVGYHPVWGKVFFVGMAVATILSLIEAYRFARMRKELGLPHASTTVTAPEA